MVGRRGKGGCCCLRLYSTCTFRAKYVIFGSRFTTSPNCVCVGSANISREPCREPAVIKSPPPPAAYIARPVEMRPDSRMPRNGTSAKPMRSLAEVGSQSQTSIRSVSFSRSERVP